jgi:hypothetical protein
MSQDRTSRNENEAESINPRMATSGKRWQSCSAQGWMATMKEMLGCMLERQAL